MHCFFRRIAWVGFAVALAATGAVSADDGQNAARLEFFEKRVRPVLVQNCFNCHSANTNSKGAVRVDDPNGLIAGGGRVSSIVPGDPEISLLIAAVR